jgi:acyl carrier protein
MEKSEILAAVIKAIRRLDKQTREISPQMLIFSDLDFDSLQMMDLLETIKGDFGIDLLASDDILRDFRSPTAIAEAIVRHNTTTTREGETRKEPECPAGETGAHR